MDAAYDCPNGSILETNAYGGGGTVFVLGDTIILNDNTVINTLNEYGGGDIFIGGSFQGSDPQVPNANNSYFGSNVIVDASVTFVGNAGNVVIWVEDTTDCQATNGQDGVLLLDPKNIIVCKDFSNEQIDGSMLKTQTLRQLLEKNHVILQASENIEFEKDFDPDEYSERLTIKIEN